MSIYSTLKRDDPDSEWFISVAAWLTDEPVRVNFGDEEWYMSEAEARRLQKALNQLFDTGRLYE